jgi:hypothetical protein
MSALPRSHCRSCNAVIEWAYTAKGSRIPLDVEPGDKPNVQLDDAGVAHVVPAGHGDRTSHFATCPNAASHRRRTSTGRT